MGVFVKAWRCAWDVAAILILIFWHFFESWTKSFQLIFYQSIEILGILWMQIFLQFYSYYGLETLHVFLWRSEDVHEVWLYSSDILLFVCSLNLVIFWGWGRELNLSLPKHVDTGRLVNAIPPTIFNGMFIKFCRVFLPRSEDVHEVWL